jgi:photosystem II cytochrome c550
MFSKRHGLVWALTALVAVGCSGGEQAATTGEGTTTAQTPAKGDAVLAAVSEDELRQGKKLFQAECGRCHVGGQTYGTYGSTDVNLSLKGLKGATPPRDTFPALIDYLKNPTSYDGKQKLVETGEHASYTALGDEKLRLIAAHVLKEANNNPGWGRGKNTR